VGVPSVTAVKTLFAASRNLCFFASCEERLTDPTWKQVNGEVAHIKGEHFGSARYDPAQTERERQEYSNLMLLCPQHHKLVDRLRPDDFPPEVLLDMKERHLEHRAAQDWVSEEEAGRIARVLVDAAASLARSQRTGSAQRSNFEYFALGAPFGASVRRVDLATDGTIEVIIDGDAPAAVEPALYRLADEQAVSIRVAWDFAPRSP
jgi:hypothetical protein